MTYKVCHFRNPADSCKLQVCCRIPANFRVLACERGSGCGYGSKQRKSGVRAPVSGKILARQPYRTRPRQRPLQTAASQCGGSTYARRQCSRALRPLVCGPPGELVSHLRCLCLDCTYRAFPVLACRSLSDFLGSIIQQVGVWHVGALSRRHARGRPTEVHIPWAAVQLIPRATFCLRRLQYAHTSRSRSVHPPSVRLVVGQSVPSALASGRAPRSTGGRTGRGGSRCAR
jgi:hypothetical protein